MKVTLNDVASLTNETSALSTINTNSNSVENAIENTLSRDGTAPNEMEAQLDMNSNRIINLPNPTTATEPLRLQDLADFLGTGIVSTIPGGGAAGEVLTKQSAADYDADWELPKPAQTYFRSNYVNLQAAVDAAAAAGGGTVVLDQDETLSTTLDLTSIFVPIHLTSMSGGANGGTGQQIVLGYSGSGTAIDATNNFGCIISNLYITNSQGGTTMISMNTTAFCAVKNCTLYHQVSHANNVGVTLGGGGSQGVLVAENSFITQGGTSIVGVDTNFSVQGRIFGNKFHVSVETAIHAPGQVWTVDQNIMQGNGTATQKFITMGAAGRCDTLLVSGNDIDDGVNSNVWIESNAGCLISMNNRYTGLSTTAIRQANSTGAVISIGDYFQGTVGVAIGTGNYLSINTPNQQLIPAQLFTGTPATARINHVFGSLVQITSQGIFGIAGSTQGSIRFLNTSTGSGLIFLNNSVTTALSIELPTVSGKLLTEAGAGTIQNKNIDTSNNITILDSNFAVHDNTDTTKLFRFEASGITTGTTRVLTVPNANTTLVGTDVAQTLTNKTIDTFTMSSVAVSRGQFPGVNGATDAAAGNIGEYIEATNTGVVLTDAAQTTVVTLNIPSAGDWDVSAKLFFAPAATTSVSRFNASISTITNSFQTGFPGQYVDNPQAAFVSGGNTFNAIIPTYRIKTTGATTFYIVCLPRFTVSTLTGSGIATARRVH